MAITYEVLQLEGYVLETWDGEITAAMLRHHWERVLQDADCLRCGRTLADLRQAELMLTDEELQVAVREVGLPLLKGRGWVSAIVVGRSAQLRMASRYQGLAAIFSQDAIFSQFDDAERWLMKQETPDDQT